MLLFHLGEGHLFNSIEHEFPVGDVVKGLVGNAVTDVIYFPDLLV